MGKRYPQYSLIFDIPVKSQFRNKNMEDFNFCFAYESNYSFCCVKFAGESWNCEKQKLELAKCHLENQTNLNLFLNNGISPVNYLKYLQEEIDTIDAKIKITNEEELKTNLCFKY